MTLAVMLLGFGGLLEIIRPQPLSAQAYVDPDSSHYVIAGILHMTSCDLLKLVSGRLTNRGEIGAATDRMRQLGC